LKGIKYQIGLQSFTPIAISDNNEPQFTLNGKQLFKMKTVERTSTAQKRAKADMRFNVQVVSKMPFLQVEFEDFPTLMLCGEAKLVKLYFRNLTTNKIKNIKIASNFMSCLCFNTPCDVAQARDPKLPDSLNNHKSNSLLYKLNDVVLDDNETYMLNMWIYMPNVEQAAQTINFMFYYENDLCPAVPQKKNNFK
jgi:hypothetical protein